MDVFEQKKVLDSFEILVDTREQDTERAHKRYASFGVPIRRAVLNYGDYAIHNTQYTFTGLCSGYDREDLLSL